jgi:hypothetical protein
MTMETETQVKKFEVGNTYYCRSVCDHECIWTYKIVSRTEKTVKTECGKTWRINQKLTAWNNGIESLYPHGVHSMCPVLTADKIQS